MVYESHYTYTIMHKHEELKVLQVQNKVNEGKFTNYTGEIVLAEGENQITVKATYRGQTERRFPLSNPIRSIMKRTKRTWRKPG